MKVLVGYATAHGSTETIAQRIGARLRARRDDVDVEVTPLRRVVDLGRYDAVVLGSAIHDGAWLPDAAQFVRDNASALAQKAVWLFSVGMPGALPPALRRWAVSEERKVLRAASSLRPRGTRLFSGVVRREDLPGSGRFVFRLLGGRYGDFRDWAAIDAWGDAIASELPATAERNSLANW